MDVVAFQAAKAWAAAHGGGGSAVVTPGYDVVLIAGQSNAAGSGSGIPLDTTNYDLPVDGVWQWPAAGSTYAGTIVRAIDPLTHPDYAAGGTHGVSPGMPFARWYAPTVPGRQVLLVPAAYGATGLVTGRWDPATPGDLYTAAITQANAAMAAAGAGARFVGVIWCQGEQDAGAGVLAATYQAKLDALIAGFRAGITGAAAAPFLILSMVPTYVASTGGDYLSIDGVHRTTPQRVPYTAFVGGADVAGVPTSLIHYTAASARSHGRPLLDALVVAQGNTSATVTCPPGHPTGVSTSIGDGQVTVSWTAPASTGGAAVTDYRVQYKLTADSTWTTFTDAVSTTTTSTVTGLVNGSGYDFRVAAVNAAGAGPNSATATGTPAGGATAPGAPTALAGTPGNGQVALAWTAPGSNGGSSITDYVVQYRTTAGPGAWTTFTDGTLTATSATVTGLTNGTGYDFQVAAVNGVGQGAYSTAASATPAASSTFLSDTFTGTNGTLLTAHTADTGQTWTLRSGTATVTINASGQGLVAGAGSTETVWVSSAVPPSADYSASMDYKPATGAASCQASAVIRADVSASTHYTIAQISTQWGIYKSVAGTASLVFGTTAQTPSGGISTAETYRLTIAATGSSISGKVKRLSDNQWMASDGTWGATEVAFRTGTDTGVTATGRAGIRVASSGTNGTLIDNFTTGA